MRVNAQKPVLTQGKGSFNESKLEHPAFAMIGASRVSGKSRPLFASEISHSNTIRLRIQTGFETRAAYGEGAVRGHHADQHIVEVEMSEAQWATMISTLNVGDGVPCTMIYCRDGKLQEMPHIDVEENETDKQKRAIESRVAKDLENLRSAYFELKQLYDSPGGIKKKDLEGIMHKLLHAVEYAPSNYQFAGSLVTEHFENLKVQAMGEIHAQLTNLALRFPGLASSPGDAKIDG
jgi:hypothetical protein